MIQLTNGHQLNYTVASGALGYSGLGWFWERPLVLAGLIRPELFTVVTKSLTLHPRAGNLCWSKPWTWLPFSPWSCVRFLPNGSAVNKVGLTNPGFAWWRDEVGPVVDSKELKLAVSLHGTREELRTMAAELDAVDVVAIELNVSCPNTGHGMSEAAEIYAAVNAVFSATRHPLILKLSVAQDYLAIAGSVKSLVQGVALNSVPWEVAFPGEASPLKKLEARVGGGGGGVSGRSAQPKNWAAVARLAQEGVPVIAPSIVSYDDIRTVRSLGAKAVSFGAVHLRTPWRPTQFVLRDMEEQIFNV